MDIFFYNPINNSEWKCTEYSKEFFKQHNFTYKTKITPEHIEEYKKLDQEDINKLFILAAKQINLELISILLTSKELPYNADINFNSNEAFTLICAKSESNPNSLAAVKYLLTSPELELKPSIDGDFNSAFKLACFYKNIKVVDYLLHSQEIEKNINIHVENDEALMIACKDKGLTLFNYFIYDLNLKITPEVQNNLKQKLSSDEYEQSMHLVGKRDLFLKIDNDFQNKPSPKRQKI